MRARRARAAPDVLGLDANAAKDVEPAFAQAGHLVISNARSYRMDPLVPLLIPEVNPDHLALLPAQRRERGWRGAIVTNPNCSTVVLALALAPLRQFGIRSVMVTTLQAVSGAGYPGVASLDILGNVVPAISGEEEKIESETQKILGALEGTGVRSNGRQRADDQGTGGRRPHRKRVDRVRREAVSRRCRRGAAIVPGAPTGAQASDRATEPNRVDTGGKSPAAASRRRSRRRHDRDGCRVRKNSVSIIAHRAGHNTNHGVLARPC
jgi:hypothetical protein